MIDINIAKTQVQISTHVYFSNNKKYSFQSKNSFFNNSKPIAIKSSLCSMHVVFFKHSMCIPILPKWSTHHCMLDFLSAPKIATLVIKLICYCQSLLTSNSSSWYFFNVACRLGNDFPPEKACNVTWLEDPPMTALEGVHHMRWRLWNVKLKKRQLSPSQERLVFLIFRC